MRLHLFQASADGGPTAGLSDGDERALCRRDIRVNVLFGDGLVSFVMLILSPRGFRSCLGDADLSFEVTTIAGGFASTCSGVWLLAPVVAVAILKVFSLDQPLERWRDARVAACDAAHKTAIGVLR